MTPLVVGRSSRRVPHKRRDTPGIQPRLNSTNQKTSKKIHFLVSTSCKPNRKVHRKGNQISCHAITHRSAQDLEVARRNNNRLNLCKLANGIIAELQVSLDHRRGSEREPLVERDILVFVRVEDFEEFEGRVSDVLDIVAERGRNVSYYM